MAYMGKYRALRDFLPSSGKDVVVLPFSEVAEIIGSELLASAFILMLVMAGLLQVML